MAGGTVTLLNPTKKTTRRRTTAKPAAEEPKKRRRRRRNPAPDQAVLVAGGALAGLGVKIAGRKLMGGRFARFTGPLSLVAGWMLHKSKKPGRTQKDIGLGLMAVGVADTATTFVGPAVGLEGIEGQWNQLTVPASRRSGLASK